MIGSNLAKFIEYICLSALILRWRSNPLVVKFTASGGGRTIYSCTFWEVAMNKLKVCDLVSWRTPIRHRIDLAQESSSQNTFTPERCKGHYASLVTSSTSSEERYKTHHDNLVVTSTSSEERYKTHHDNLVVTSTSSEVRYKR